MKTMKIWRKSRLSESRANSFANGRTGAIYAIAFAILAAFSLASCSSDDAERERFMQSPLRYLLLSPSPLAAATMMTKTLPRKLS